MRVDSTRNESTLKNILLFLWQIVMRIGESGIVPSTGKGLNDGDVSRNLLRPDTPGKSDNYNQVTVEIHLSYKRSGFHCCS